MIQVGSIFATTGALASFGVPYLTGLQLAASEINSAGGAEIGGRTYKVQVTNYNDQDEPSLAVTDAEKILASGTHIVFCCNLGSESVPVANIINPDNMLISPNSETVSLLGPKDPLEFKNFGAEEGPQGTTAQFVPWVIQHTPTVKTAAIMVPTTGSDPAGQVYVDAYSTVLKALGIKVIDVERYSETATDFTPQLTKMIAARPDIAFIGFSDLVGSIFKQAQQLGAKFIMAGTMGVSGVSCEGITGECFVPGAPVDPALPADGNQKLQAFIDGYKTQCNCAVTAGDSGAVMTYDWLKLIVATMEKLGTTDLRKVASAIRGSTYHGVATWNIDSLGIGALSVQGIEYVNGSFKQAVTLPIPSVAEGAKYWPPGTPTNL